MNIFLWFRGKTSLAFDIRLGGVHVLFAAKENFNNFNTRLAGK